MNRKKAFREWFEGVEDAYKAGYRERVKTMRRKEDYRYSIVCGICNRIFGYTDEPISEWTDICCLDCGKKLIFDEND